MIASLLMLSGSTGDRFGRRRTFQIGLTLFTLGSLLCSIAPGLGWLIAFRELQAVGGTMLNPVAMSIVTNVFTDPRNGRGRSASAAAWSASASPVGPLLGGLLVESVGWRSSSGSTCPIGIVAIFLAADFRARVESAACPRRLDPVGQVLVILVLGLLISAIIEAPGQLGLGAGLGASEPCAAARPPRCATSPASRTADRARFFRMSRSAAPR